MSDESPAEVGQASNREQQIQLLIDAFVAQLQAGESPDEEAIQNAHLDLNPELSERLKLVRQLQSALKAQKATLPSKQLSDFGSQIENEETWSAPVGPERALQLKCPHCGVGIQVVDSITDVTCRNCGSTFHVDANRTRSFHAVHHPEKIGRFEIQELLGRGGFGAVYRARDPQLGRDVAIKIPRDRYFLSHEDEQRFLHEARGVSRLRHANIVSVHEVDREHGMPFIVSEFIAGLTLADLVSGRKVDDREAAEMIAAVADALAYAHEHHVIHRDIKPSNILIDHSGKPYVVDFGLARTADPEFTMTVEGQVLGTPTYMSPEQAEGKASQLDHRTDIYSLGVVLYRVLSGELPFRGSQRMLLHQVMHDEPPSLRTINESVPRDLEVITLKAMAKEPSRRYQSASELAAELRRWLRGEPIHARPLGRLERCLRWSRRNPLVASLCSGLVALLLLTAVVATGWAARERTLHEETRQARDKEAEARTLADRHATESRKRLSRTLTNNGVDKVTDQDFFGALNWFTEALPHIDDEHDQRVQRIRLGLLWNAVPKLRQFVAFDSPLHVAAVSRDGKRAVVNDSSRKLHIVELDSGLIVASTEAPDRCFAVKISADGNSAIAAGRDGSTLFWNVATRPPQVNTAKHARALTDMALSPDGTQVATASLDKSACIWDVASAKRLQTLPHEDIVTRVTFSHDGKTLLTVSGKQKDPFFVRFWDVSLGTRHEHFVRFNPDELNDDRYLWAIPFDPSGTRFATASMDGTAAIWNAVDAKPIHASLRHGSAVFDATFSHDGKRLATATADGFVHIWNVLTGVEEVPALRHSGAVKDLEFSPDDELLICNSDNGFWTWRSRDGRSLPPRFVTDGRARCVGFAGSSDRIVTIAETGALRVWELRVDGASESVLRHDAKVTSGDFSDDGKRILTASWDGVTRVWNSTDGSLITALKTNVEVTRVRFHQGTETIATTSSDLALRFWDARQGVAIGQPMPHPMPIRDIVFAKSGEQVVTACADGVVRAWNVKSQQLVHSLQHDGVVVCIEENHLGGLIASGSEDRSVRIWNLATGKSVGGKFAHDAAVSQVAWSLDDKFVVAGSSDGVIHAWDVQKQSPIIKHKAHTASIPAIAFSPDGTTLGTVSSDGSMLLTSTENWRPKAPLRHSSVQRLGFARFSGDGLLFATAGLRNPPSSTAALGDGLAQLWDAQTGVLVSPPLQHLKKTRDLDWNLQGNRLLTVSEDGTARIWKVESDDRSIDELRRAARRYTGMRINEVGGIVAIPATELSAVPK